MRTERASPASRNRARVGRPWIRIGGRNDERALVRLAEPTVHPHDLVAHLQEAALLNVRPKGGGEHGTDRGAGRVDRLGKVEPLEAAVLERRAGHLGAADRVSGQRVAGVRRGRGVGRSERLLGVPVVGEGPVHSRSVGQDLAENAFGHRELGTRGRDGALGIDEVVHERRQPVGVGEVVVHGVGRVEDQEHVRVGTGVGLEELAVVGARGGRHQKEGQKRGRHAVAFHESDEAAGCPMVSHETSPQNGNRAGRGPISASATSALEYCRKASFCSPVERTSNAYMY